MILKRFILSAALSVPTAPALAHTGAGPSADFTTGFLHPVHGLDHVLVMVTVGLFAALLGGRALWTVPASFVVMMLAGGSLGLAGTDIPAAETGIVVSIIVIGGVVALGGAWPASAAMALVGVFAVFHGYAHGAEMPLGSGAISYSLGFATATALLHGIGIAGGMASLRSRQAIRFAGAAVALMGIVVAVA
ncbi:HupE/UreJ family protein [Microvirga sp. GCM10011540]|uniref:HupE/UreJ family protein n=1 Tax=Microvirga sp. GCM10011540 TaxID=3317338 RepID=UPI00361A2C17